MSQIVSRNLTTGDNQHPLEAFFGPYSGSHEKQRADDQLSHETYNLPEAYKGKNRFLEEVLDFKIRKEDEFYTSRLLPWEYTDDLHIKWDIFSFNRTIADLEPEQGLPRYVSASSESHSDNLLRRGLAFIIEHGFYKTERGKRHFNLNLAQITDAVHTTCYFGVIHALLAGQNYYKEWERKFGRQVTRQNDLMALERRRWGIVQKSKNGLYLLDAELRHEMKREGTVPNTWVWPDKMGIYANMVGEQQTSYHERGNQANENREKGDQKTSFRGLPVFEAQSFDVDFTGQPVDLMVRERQCGEYFTLKSGDTLTEAADGGDASDNRKYIYDADKDSWAALDHKTLTENAVNIDAVGDANSDLLIFRPHQTYRMASGILAEGGSALGSTFHGHHDFMMSDDIIRKVHVGHYTFYSKSVVKNPKKYVIVEDIFAQGYVGGENAVAFDGAEAYIEKAGEGLLGRGDCPSLIVVRIPKDASDGLKDCIDITGRFHPSIYDKMGGSYSEGGDDHYKGAAEVQKALQLEQIEPYRQTDIDQFHNRVQRVNTVCFQGMEGRKVDGGFKPIKLNKGHWGINVYPGCKRVREGENSFMSDCQYKVGI